MLDSLEGISIAVLSETGAGRAVNGLKRHEARSNCLLTFFQKFNIIGLLNCRNNLCNGKMTLFYWVSVTHQVRLFSRCC